MTDSIELADKSSELLNNDAFIEAVRRTENSLIDQWKTTGPRDTDTRESIYFQQQAIAMMVSTLVDMASEPLMVDDPIVDKEEPEGT